MGTTLVAAIVRDGKTTIVNVGDSRAYHIDDGIEQITVDQSLVQRLVENGEITEGEAQDHPQSNVVEQSLGTTATVEPDFYEQEIEGYLLLCSDGLTAEVADETIHQIVSESSDIETAAKSLVDRANENGGSDNASVVLHEK